MQPKELLNNQGKFTRTALTSALVFIGGLAVEFASLHAPALSGFLHLQEAQVTPFILPAQILSGVGQLVTGATTLFTGIKLYGDENLFFQIKKYTEQPDLRPDPHTMLLLSAPAALNFYLAAQQLLPLLPKW